MYAFERCSAHDDAQGGLATHADDSELSFNLLLSRPTDFGGGGTSFEAAGVTLLPAQGEMLSHFGQVRHTRTPALGEGCRCARRLRYRRRPFIFGRAAGGAVGCPSQSPPVHNRERVCDVCA